MPSSIANGRKSIVRETDWRPRQSSASSQSPRRFAASPFQFLPPRAPALIDIAASKAGLPEQALGGRSFDLGEATTTLRTAAPGWFGQKDRQIVAVVLGSGLGGLSDSIEDVTSVGYDRIAGLASTTASGHRGEFLLGNLGHSRIIAMAGRLHAYEGHCLETLTRPMQLMASLNPHAVVVSCAAGGLNPRFTEGDVVLIDEHMSLLHGRIGGGPAPGKSSNGESAWPANRSGLPTCDSQLAELADNASRDRGFTLRRGTYLATTGPTYETRAECRMMRSWGVDLVGMSTVPELVWASRLGLRTLAVGVVTNMAVPDAPQTANHDEVLAVSSGAGEKLEHIVREIANHTFNKDS